MDENSSDKKENKPDKVKKNFTDEIRKNPWILSTLILGAIAVILLVGNFGESGNVISDTDAGQSLLDFANSQGANAELVGVSEEGNFYEVTLLIQGQNIPIYVTKDGEYFTSSLIPLDLTEQPSQETPQGTEIPKTERPSAELYIWSYCPYGVTAIEPFADVESLLSDYADFKIYLYYAGHGDFEVQQNKIQACMQQLNYDNYFDYAKAFANEIYEKCSGDASCDLSESTTLMDSLGINSDEVFGCVETQGDALLEEHYNAALNVGVTGSPSLVINGVKASPSSRTAEGFKESICSGFANAPELCNTELTSTASTASGSC